MTWGLLRVKNEARWIGRVIDSIVPICDRVLLMDDSSTDETREISAAHGAKVLPTPFSSRGSIHEAADKDWLLAQVWSNGATVGDHCLMIDGDEMLHPADVPVLRAAIERGVTAGSMHIVYLWDREDQARVDRIYREFRRPSLFRLTSHSLSFLRTGCGGEFHCSSVPQDLFHLVQPLPVRLLHFGYMLREDRIRKYRWYNSIDPDNPVEDHYFHIAQGDLPEIPAGSAFRHAGPLTLVPLDTVLR